MLEADSVEVTSTGETPTPVSVSAEEFASGANSARLNGLLVRVNSLSLESNAGTSWTMTGEPAGTLTVGNRLIGSLPSYPGGQVRITGIADTVSSGQLLPRLSTDIQKLV